jgi:hypothetical protein
MESTRREQAEFTYNQELPSIEKKHFLQVTMEIEMVSKVYSVDFVC